MIQDFQSYKEQLNRISFGKRVGQNLYLYFEDLEKENEELHRFIEHVKDSLPGKPIFNIVKFFLNAFKISCSPPGEVSATKLNLPIINSVG